LLRTVYTNAPSVLAYRLRKPWLKVAGSGRDDSIEAFFRELQDEENAFVLAYREHVGGTRSGLQMAEEIAESNEHYGVLDLVADAPTFMVWRVRSDGST